MENLFIKALKNSTRFASAKGLLTTEDLFQLPLQSKNGTSLDAVARTIYNEIKESEEVSFVSPTVTSTELADKLEIVKFIITMKKDDQAAKVAAKEKAEERKRLIQLRNSKVYEKESSLSLEEIEARIDSL